VPDDLQLPPGWDSDDFDVLAALTGDAPACAPAGEDTTEHPGGDRPPATTEDASMLSVDLTDVRDAGARLLAGERARLAGHPPPTPLPEPLGSVLAVILKPGCPEWVPSEILAVAIGRVPASADEDDRKRAGEQLGHELNRQTGLTSEQRRTGKGRRWRGFLTADLKAAALRLGEAG
jgi:hypothetical protein